MKALCRSRICRHWRRMTRLTYFITVGGFSCTDDYETWRYIEFFIGFRSARPFRVWKSLYMFWFEQDFRYNLFSLMDSPADILAHDPSQNKPISTSIIWTTIFIVALCSIGFSRCRWWHIVGWRKCGRPTSGIIAAMFFLGNYSVAKDDWRVLRYESFSKVYKSIGIHSV